MKKAISLILLLTLSLSLFGCGKSQAVKDTETAIKAIGEVNLDSLESIERAERLYSILTDKEKSKIRERGTLVGAREAYERLRTATIYTRAKEAYDILNEQYQLISDFFDDFIGAFSFLFNQALNNEYSTDVLGELTNSTPHLTRDKLEEAVDWYSNETGKSKEVMLNNLNLFEDYEDFVGILAGAYKTDFERLDEIDPKTILQELNDIYNDQVYYPKLKEYYLRLESIPDFFTEVDWTDLSTILNWRSKVESVRNSYEKQIVEVQRELSFLFN